MKNKILSMTLCAALIFTMLATPQIQPPAHAEAVALTATVIAVAVTLIVAAGVTWTSIAMGKQCTTQFLTDKPEAKQIIQDIVAAMPQTGVLVLTKTMLPKVKQFMQMVKSYFDTKNSIEVSDDTVQYLNDIPITKSPQLMPAESLYNITKDTVTTKVGVTIKLTWTVTYLLTYAGKSSGEMNDYNVLNSDGSVTSLRVNHYKVNSDGSGYYPKDITYRLGFFIANSCLNLYLVCKAVYPDGKIEYSADTRNGASNNTMPLPSNYILKDGYLSLPVDTINLGNIDDINEAIAHSVGQAAEGVKVDIQKLIEEIEAAKEDALPWTVEGVRDLIGIQDELKEIAREQERIRDAIKEGTKEDDMSVPQLPTTITEKFPFCVPFDLIALAKTFSAEPVAPKVTIPVVFESMHYSHDFVFDFSGDNWDKVAAVIRWGTLIFFILGLTLVTRKLIKG